MPTVARLSEEETKLHAQLLLAELTKKQLDEGMVGRDVDSNPNLEFLNVQMDLQLMNRIGKELRILSEEFAKSPQRSQVLQKAKQVDINSITHEEFMGFLDELFTDGITKERIVVLFFFCSDVVVRAYSNPESLRNLFMWSLEFIFDRVCGWVRDHGGWGVVLETYLPKVNSIFQALFWVFGTIAFGTYIYKKIKT